MFEAIAKSSPGVPPLDGGVLAGFPGLRAGGHDHVGCLTRNESVRFHACELGTGCIARRSAGVIFIQPVIGTTIDGNEVLEAGAAGNDDSSVMKLDLKEEDVVSDLLRTVTIAFPEADRRRPILDMIRRAATSEGRRLQLHADFHCGTENLSFKAFMGVLEKHAAREKVQYDSKGPHKRRESNPASHVVGATRRWIDPG